IGGGFPELYARELEANAALRGAIRDAIDAGLPVYAECGGLMYLSRSIRSDGASWKMVGAIPADIVMRERPVGRGYVELEETAAFPWPAAGEREAVVRAHEFHHAAVENLGPGLQFAYAVKRGHGIDGERDGIVIGNVLASFAHLRSTRRNEWAARFVEFARGCGHRQRHSRDWASSGTARRHEAPII
ncbi:MAG: cobyrinic acid a,c-diamide synthase, partial [Candidatus Levyibacteriota bacterium]